MDSSQSQGLQILAESQEIGDSGPCRLEEGTPFWKSTDSLKEVGQSTAGGGRAGE